MNNQKINTAQQDKTSQLTSKLYSHHILRIWIILGSFVLLMGLFISYANADENLYAKNYKAQNIYNLASMQANPDTKMYVSNHKDEDNISMLENGYDMMGTSGFDAGNVPADLALQHGKSIKADVVLVYTKYGASKGADSKMQMIKEAIKNGKELTEKDVTEDATLYKYYASYWAKMPTPSLGVHIIKLVPKSDSVDSTDNNAGKGLRILAVIKDSPAYTAGLLRGDQLIAINDVPIEKPDDLTGIISKNHGKSINIRYIRENQELTTNTKLN
ncbi:MAG: PDZ domain-containing protein [Methylophilus sp.]